jgi:hypothetical protein
MVTYTGPEQVLHIHLANKHLYDPDQMMIRSADKHLYDPDLILSCT